MKSSIKKLNDIFILIVLTVFYVTGVGLSWILYSLFKKNGVKEKATYWSIPPTVPLDEKYYLSSY